MCKIKKLELEFEIVTLSHNIEKFRKMGIRTESMQARLNFCQSEFNKLNAIDKCDENDSFDYRTEIKRKA